MRRIKRLPGLSWAISGVADQALGLYERLPERWRGWIEAHLVAPVLGAMTALAFLIWGIIRDTDPYWVAFVTIVVLFCVTVLAMIGGQGIHWLKRQAFDVTPTDPSGFRVGIGKDLFYPDRVYARISVTSKRDVTRCVALLTEVYFREQGRMIRHVWNPRYLSWMPEEDRLRTAILSTGITMMADLAVCNTADPWHFEFTSADNGRRHQFPQGLYKVGVTVLSESGGGARRDVWLALTHVVSPGPVEPLVRLIVQPWLDSFVGDGVSEEAQ